MRESAAEVVSIAAIMSVLEYVEGGNKVSMARSRQKDKVLASFVPGSQIQAGGRPPRQTCWLAL